MKGLNHKEIKKDPQGITETKPFINRYNRIKVKFSSEKDGWKKIEKNNVTIAFHTLHAKKEKIYPADASKHNSSCEKQNIF